MCYINIFKINNSLKIIINIHINKFSFSFLSFPFLIFWNKNLPLFIKKIILSKISSHIISSILSKIIIIIITIKYRCI